IGLSSFSSVKFTSQLAVVPSRSGWLLVDHQRLPSEQLCESFHRTKNRSAFFDRSASYKDKKTRASGLGCDRHWRQMEMARQQELL
ncbi:MAG TPA: hypothetical protein VGG15_09250, partial [Terriglobales bacterium]